MFIIPYYIEKPVKSKLFTTWKAWVFMANGGKELWSDAADEENKVKDVVANYLTPNGFTGKTRHDKKANCLYMDINPESTRTDFSDLYTWVEMLKDAKDIPNEFILRPFIWIGDTPGAVDEWGWREQCENVSLGGYGTIATLWDGIKV
jgi:hypothetical protein